MHNIKADFLRGPQGPGITSVHLTVGMAQVVADALVAAINRTKEDD
jgi:hypothetical protein